MQRVCSYEVLLHRYGGGFVCSAPHHPSAGQLLLMAANGLHDNEGPQIGGGGGGGGAAGAVLLDLGPQRQSDLTPSEKPSIPPSQAVLFRSSWTASSHNEIADFPIRSVWPHPHCLANEGEPVPPKTGSHSMYNKYTLYFF